MIQKQWANAGRKYIVCVDSYDAGVMKGRICDPSRGTESFSSLMQFLLKMEDMLDEQQMPQAYTMPRKFSMLLQPEMSQSLGESSKGGRSTFELKVIFRQNTSWQGILVWRETRQEQSFRSVLELVILMDSALRSEKGCGLA